jgi:hypothetical protein
MFRIERDEQVKKQHRERMGEIEIEIDILIDG